MCQSPVGHYLLLLRTVRYKQLLCCIARVRYRNAGTVVCTDGIHRPFRRRQCCLVECPREIESLEQH